MTNNTIVKQTRFDALDGLRFVFIALIVIEHMDGLFKLPSVPIVNIFGLFVIYFFMLSGFVLAYQYPQFSNLFVWLRYLGARFARLGPLALLGFVLICALNPYPTFDRSLALPSFIANLFLVQAWIPDKNFYLCYNAPSWTLSVEIFLYAILPLCLIAARRKYVFLFSSIIFSCAICLGAVVFSIHDVSWATSIFPPQRLMDFAFGIVTYKVFAERKKPLSLGWSLLLESLPLGYFFGLVFLMANFPQQNELPAHWLVLRTFCAGRLLPAITFAGLILALTAGTGPLKTLLSSRIFIWLGGLSASLYFLHFPIKVHFDLISQGVSVSHPYRLYVMILILVVGLSALAFQRFEVPLRHHLNLFFDKIFATYFPGKTIHRWHANPKVQSVSTNRFVLTYLATLIAVASLFCYIESSIQNDRNMPGIVNH